MSYLHRFWGPPVFLNLPLTNSPLLCPPGSPPPWGLLLTLLQGLPSWEAGLAEDHPGCFSSHSSHIPGDSPSQDTSAHHTHTVFASGFKTPIKSLVVRTGLLAGYCHRSPELEAWEPHLLLLPPEDTPLTSQHPCPGPTPVFCPLSESTTSRFQSPRLPGSP